MKYFNMHYTLISLSILQDEGVMQKKHPRWLSHINILNVKVTKNMAYRCSKFNACCLLSCRDNSSLDFCICRTTMTLHQGQGHRNDHEQAHIPGKSLPSCQVWICDMAIIVQVKHVSSWRRSFGLEWRARASGRARLSRPLVRLSSQQTWRGLLEHFLI